MVETRKFGCAALAMFAGLVTVIGCSSGSGSPLGGGGGKVGTCESVCNKAASLGCPNDDLQACIAECEAEGAEAKAACPNEYGRMLGCTENLTLVCGSSGTATIADEDQIYAQCRSELSAYAACTACDPQTDDDACDSCSKQNCCSQRQAAYGDPAVFDLLECLGACDDSACSQACASKYPGLISKGEALASCESSQCGATC